MTVDQDLIDRADWAVRWLRDISQAEFANYRLDVSKKLDDVRKVINDLMKEKT